MHIPRQPASALTILTILTLLSWTKTGSTKFKLGQQLNFHSETNSTSLYIKFEVDRIFAEQGIAFQFKSFSNLLCPSYAHWFKKDSPLLPALSFGLACDKFEVTPTIKIELARDWHRIKDEVIGNTYYFEGRLDYSVGPNTASNVEYEPVVLEEYGLLDVNEIRVRSAPSFNSTTGEPLDFTYFARASTIIFN